MKKIYILAFILLGLLAVACKTPQQLAQKAIAKGYTFPEKTVHDTVEVLVKVQGRDSVIRVPVAVPCPDTEPLKPRYVYRYENKRAKDSTKQANKVYADSLDHVLKMSKERNDALEDSLKQVRRMHKQSSKTKRVETRQENKRSLWWLWYGLGFLSCVGVWVGAKRFKIPFI